MRAAIPTVAMTNSVVGGIKNSVLVGGGAVSATAKNAIAQSGTANVRWNTSAILSLLIEAGLG
jgi:hypothetical protein